jgi:hypothetical protein
MLRKLLLTGLVALVGWQAALAPVRAGDFSNCSVAYINGQAFNAHDVAVLVALARAREAQLYAQRQRQAYWRAQVQAAARQAYLQQIYANRCHGTWSNGVPGTYSGPSIGGSPADRWLSGNEWSGRSGLTSGTVGRNARESVYSVGGTVLTLP